MHFSSKLVLYLYNNFSAYFSLILVPYFLHLALNAMCSRIIKELQDGEAPFISLDPLLLPLLVNRCPSDELPALVSILPTYISSAKILMLIDAKKGVASKFDYCEVREEFACCKSSQTSYNILYDLTYPIL